MWELIKANRRKSIILFVCLAICLVILGYLIGAAIFPPDGGITGIFIASGIWFVMSLIGLSSGDSILLSISQAKEITHDIHPQLFNIVEEMKIAANLPAMPRVYVINNTSPNAFATGINLKKSSIVVTSGLLARLNRDELQGVVAHEMSHIANSDVLFMTLAGIMLGSIVLISQSFLRGMFYSSGASSRRYSGKRSSAGGGQAQLVIILVAVAFAVLAPILAHIFYFAISRKREYLADACAVRLTRYPEGLASALSKISSSFGYLSVANKITAPMYITNPLKQKEGVSLDDWSNTHPPIHERINILRGIAGGANYTNYQNAYNRIRKKSSALIPNSGLQDTEPIPFRQANPEAIKEDQARSKKYQMRELGDITRAVNGFIFAVCVCGLKVKVPPNFKKSQIKCTRCSRDIPIPVEAMVAVGAMSGLSQTTADNKKDFVNRPWGKEAQQEPQVFVRKTKSWESVRCNRCGLLMQVSPLFAGTKMPCHKCKATIGIVSHN